MTEFLNDPDDCCCGPELEEPESLTYDVIGDGVDLGYEAESVEFVAGDAFSSFDDPPADGYETVTVGPLGLPATGDTVVVGPVETPVTGEVVTVGPIGQPFVEAVAIPAQEATSPSWTHIGEGEWAAMSDAERIASFLGTEPGTAPIAMPQTLGMPQTFGMPTMTDITNQLADITLTQLAPSGLTAGRDSAGNSVWVDSGGYESPNLNNFRRDPDTGSYHE